MSDWPDVPNFGALLRTNISSVSAEARPAFLAGLERSAAQRYREWAASLPQHAGPLLDCAEREDEIADVITELFPVSADDRAAIETALPDAIAVYYDVFAPFTVTDQLYLQSQAELQGAQAWVNMAEAVDDPATLDALAHCAALETASSEVVSTLLADLRAPQN